jgi:hypothetical protein
MKTLKFESREAWLNGRLGLITGSEVRKTVTLRGDGIKSGVYRRAYESIAGAAAINEEDDERAMDRGIRLEPEAIARFEKETGKKVDSSLVLWVSDEDPRMGVSPDGFIGKTIALEVKCLSGAKHVEALDTRKIPENTGGYEEQVIQYFIVNEKLRTLYFVLYNPTLPAPLDYLCLTFTRKEMQPEIDRILGAERRAVAQVRRIVNELTLYSPDEIKAVRKREAELLATNEAVHRSNLELIGAKVKAKAQSHG